MLWYGAHPESSCVIKVIQMLQNVILCIGISTVLIQNVIIS